MCSWTLIDSAEFEAKGIIVIHKISNDFLPPCAKVVGGGRSSCRGRVLVALVASHRAGRPPALGAVHSFEELGGSHGGPPRDAGNRKYSA